MNSVITLIDVFETVRVNSYFAKYVDFLWLSLLKFTCFCGVSFPLESGIFTLKPAFMVKVQVRSVTICSNSKPKRKNLRVIRAPYFLAFFSFPFFFNFIFAWIVALSSVILYLSYVIYNCSTIFGKCRSFSFMSSAPKILSVIEDINLKTSISVFKKVWIAFLFL